MSENQKSPDLILRKEDFESIVFLFDIKNNTTSTKVPNTPPSQLIQFDDDEVKLSIPRKSAAKGHNIQVNISSDKSNEHTKNFSGLEFTGKIIELEADDENYDSITLKVVQVDRKSLQSFLDIFSSRQNDINDFFNAVRGY